MAEHAALVTGASSGIGLAVARVLAEEGYALTICARRPEPLADAAAALSAGGAEVSAVPANLAHPSELTAAVSAHAERYGQLDVLVNNAGYGGPTGPMEALETRRLDLLLAVNVRAAWLAIRECEPMLRRAGAEHGKALVANTASVAAKDGQAGIAAYSAAKAALLGVGRAAHAELGPAGVQVTTLCPALVATPMSEWIESVPQDEMLRPEDLSEAVRFLLRTSRACHVPELVMIRPQSLV